MCQESDLLCENKAHFRSQNLMLEKDPVKFQKKLSGLRKGGGGGGV